jgi:uncharacterized protein
MKVCVMSDSHGNRSRILEVLKRESPDLVIHAGDFADDILDTSKQSTANMRVFAVAGNCDTPGTAAEEQTTAFGDVRLWITHGHRYNVKQGYLNLVLKAQENGANIVVFGHSHVPSLFVEAGKLFLNPGSLSQPRGYSTPTYAVFEWAEDDGEGKREQTCSIQYKSAYDGTVCDDLTRSLKWDGTVFSIVS